MATTIDRAAIVAKAVQLESVSLSNARFDSAFDPLAPSADVAVGDVKYRGRYVIAGEELDYLYVWVDLVLEATSGVPEDDVETMLHLEACYLLIYRLPQADSYPEDALKHFADINGTYNVWPYWRELVQTVSGRVGMPSIIVPVYRPKGKEIADDAEQEGLNLEEATTQESRLKRLTTSERGGAMDT